MARAAHTQLPQPVFHEPIFGEDGSPPDPTGFSTAHGSDTALYQQIGDLAKKDVVAIPESRIAADQMFGLAEAHGSHGPQITKIIEDAGKIIFHAFDDSGASNSGKYANELRVGDQVTLDSTSSSEGDRAAFLFHLGDVVYNFGEAQYYYDQFYEPFRNYPAPIFAIPGNHDSFVVPGTAAGRTPLDTFQRNFCSKQLVITPEAGSLHRTAMTQPGVYFALDAPFVRIIGLFSNALEDPGVISNLDHKWAAVSNVQIDFLRAQLKRIKQENYPGAVLLATHHPPYSYSPPTQAALVAITAAAPSCSSRSTRFARRKACTLTRSCRAMPITTSVTRGFLTSAARRSTFPSSFAATAAITSILWSGRKRESRPWSPSAAPTSNISRAKIASRR